MGSRKHTGCAVGLAILGGWVVFIVVVTLTLVWLFTKYGGGQ